MILAKFYNATFILKGNIFLNSKFYLSEISFHSFDNELKYLYRKNCINFHFKMLRSKFRLVLKLSFYFTNVFLYNLRKLTFYKLDENDCKLISSHCNVDIISTMHFF